MLSKDAIQRRLSCLEWQDNDYFKAGMKAAVAMAEANGFTIKSFDTANYPHLDDKEVSSAVISLHIEI